MFVLNLLFGENFCNLNCEYCAYTKKKALPLDNIQMKRARSNIIDLKNLSEKFFPEFKILSITGGEPLMYYSVVKLFLELFRNKHIRISTNGLTIDKIDLDLISKHGNAYFAISLDGHTIGMNSTRFKEQEILNNIFKNIDLLLEKNIHVEILTTLHSGNIDGFFDFSSYISKKYQSSIETGKLWLLASPVVDYFRGRSFSPSKDQKNAFIDNFEKYSNDLVISKSSKYYKNLCKFYGNKERERCKMYEWSFDVKYLDDNLWENGKFLLYGCGCRGLKILENVDLKSRLDDKIAWERMNSERLKKYFFEECDICKKNCFNNWHFYDLYLKGKINGRDNAILNNYEKK